MSPRTDDPMRTWLTRLSLAAGVAFTAHAEYDLARTLGADPWIAAMLPVAVDAYVVAALRWFRGFDITLSLSLMGAAQVAAHLLDAKVMTVNIPMVVIVSLLVPVAIWRTHALARSEHAVPAAPAPVPAAPAPVPAAPAPVPVEVQRVPEPPETYPAIAKPVPAAPEQTPVDHFADSCKVTPVLAAEEPRTRTEVHAEYVPDPVPEDDDEHVLDPDPLVAESRHVFAHMLTQGEVPGVRVLRARHGIGQPRAQRIRDALKETL
ncbi:hypothetical protein [Streptomyces sp. NPDC018833]|uniref:hypothetical protein n=1 Tax=Streptomyces sp. NPDC018833 TaxID=3365053 RepID=UPI0037A4471E